MMVYSLVQQTIPMLQKMDSNLMAKSRYSIIIPTFNEEKNIQTAIRSVKKQNNEAEIIVVDGGSTDSTKELALAENAIFVNGVKGRGSQFNAGAQKATGDFLIFLHADTTLPAQAFRVMNGHFSNPDLQIGRFRLKFDSAQFLMRLFAFFSRFDSMFTSFGDQCIITRKLFFEKIGGFPDWPLFEDVHLLRLARRKTRVYSLPAHVTTSGRRFIKYGIVRCQLINGWLIVQYLMGVKPERLAQYYYSDYFLKKNVKRLTSDIFFGVLKILKNRLFQQLNKQDA